MKSWKSKLKALEQDRVRGHHYVSSSYNEVVFEYKTWIDFPLEELGKGSDLYYVSLHSAWLKCPELRIAETQGDTLFESLESLNLIRITDSLEIEMIVVAGEVQETTTGTSILNVYQGRNYGTISSMPRPDLYEKLKMLYRKRERTVPCKKEWVRLKKEWIRTMLEHFEKVNII